MTGQWIEAGLFKRGQIRRELIKANVKFTETKSLTSSVFVVHDIFEFEMMRRTLQKQGLLS